MLGLQPGAFAHVYEALGEDLEPYGGVEMTKRSPSISRIPAINIGLSRIQFIGVTFRELLNRASERAIECKGRNCKSRLCDSQGAWTAMLVRDDQSGRKSEAQCAQCQPERLIRATLTREQQVCCRRKMIRR